MELKLGDVITLVPIRPTEVTHFDIPGQVCPAIVYMPPDKRKPDHHFICCVEHGNKSWVNLSHYKVSKVEEGPYLVIHADFIRKDAGSVWMTELLVTEVTATSFDDARHRYEVLKKSTYLLIKNLKTGEKMVYDRIAKDMFASTREIFLVEPKVKKSEKIG